MEQGRLASAHACGLDVKPISASLPIGIYTIPEISFVGSTEEQLTQEQTPYEVGISRYRELARGAILGDAYGMLKLLVSADDRRLLGVHAFGTTATELVHIGQTVMGFGGTVDYLVEAVFNYPTLAEGYKVAALDATNKLRAISTLSASRQPDAKRARPQSGRAAATYPPHRRASCKDACPGAGRDPLGRPAPAAGHRLNRGASCGRSQRQSTPVNMSRPRTTLAEARPGSPPRRSWTSKPTAASRSSSGRSRARVSRSPPARRGRCHRRHPAAVGEHLRTIRHPARVRRVLANVVVRVERLHRSRGLT